MERLDRNVCSLQSALQQRPKVLDAVCMNFAANVFCDVIYSLMDERRRFERTVSIQPIAVELRALL